jgi:hypothetical protein
MKNTGLIISLTVVALLVAAFAFFVILPAASDEAVVAKYCNASGSAAMVYRCENSTYLVKPILADIGSTYVDSEANPIAACGGFINVHPPECPALENLTCNRTENLCNATLG